jgi:hypothetical protein
MTYAGTRTNTSTYTEARARYVVGKVYEDFLSMLSRGLITKHSADKWREDLIYIMGQQALDQFEVQFTRPNGKRDGFRYKLDDSGNIYTDDDSGEVDYYDWPNGTVANLVVTLRENSIRYRDVLEELHSRRGWGNNGSSLEGDNSDPRSFSNSGYGLNRNKIG